MAKYYIMSLEGSFFGCIEVGFANKYSFAFFFFTMFIHFCTAPISLFLQIWAFDELCSPTFWQILVKYPI